MPAQGGGQLSGEPVGPTTAAVPLPGGSWTGPTHYHLLLGKHLYGEYILLNHRKPRFLKLPWWVFADSSGAR